MEKKSLKRVKREIFLIDLQMRISSVSRLFLLNDWNSQSKSIPQNKFFTWLEAKKDTVLFSFWARYQMKEFSLS